MSSTKQSLKTTTLYNVIENNFHHIVFIAFYCIYILFDFWAINTISNYYDNKSLENPPYQPINSSLHLRYNNDSELLNEFYQKKYMAVVHPETFNSIKNDFTQIQYYLFVCLFINIFTVIFGYILNDIVTYTATNLVSIGIKPFILVDIYITNG